MKMIKKSIIIYTSIIKIKIINYLYLKILIRLINKSIYLKTHKDIKLIKSALKNIAFFKKVHG